MVYPSLPSALLFRETLSSMNFPVRAKPEHFGIIPTSPLSPLAVISVKYGLRYRFRLVSLSCDPNFIFKIDSHNISIIEADGISHQPVTVDSLQIFAGQRYSFILNATQKIDNYWIRATPDYVNTGFANNTNSAILRYVGASPTDPTTISKNGTNLLKETDLHPLVPVPVPGVHKIGAADVSINLDIGTDLSNPASPRYTLNGVSFQPPTAPTASGFLHCHIDYHLNIGLAVILVESRTTIQQDKFEIPPAWDDLCPIYNAAANTTQLG
ncbi:Cu-oxidase-domain-containing protein [Mycena sanguinolenta]|uniref:laccase n=1 Tax=Mycena sanguinolenta TaxID=230812 RepID=A0A8H7DK89_9AGAR|nr:Cu-oxidase-domain-containing protein [Mycena sanguinolenta]